MSELIWINGEVMPLADARIGVEDRGFQFADGVYEVIRIYNGKPFTLNEHLNRLKKSAIGIRLTPPIKMPELEEEIRKFIAGTPVKDGMVYLQMTRGSAPRNHAFPECKPTLLFYIRPLDPVVDVTASEGVKLLCVEDERWKRCWIKSIALLPNVLAKNKALAAGADEAVFIDDGVVTECSSSNVLFVRGGRLITHPVGAKVLGGITREVLIEIASELGIAVEQSGLPEEEARLSDEIFITSTTREISWVARWDDRKVGGKCGPVTAKLHHALREMVMRQTA
jgi:D-alanine transaminase